jgi:glycosyltransferase involved in cell wall biosynthesis
MNEAGGEQMILPLRVLHLNSLLTGGGTDDQCVRLAQGLHLLGQQVSLAGPDGRDFSKVVRDLHMPFYPTPPEGPLKLGFIFAAARLIRTLGVRLVHGHHGRDLWPTIIAARLSGVHPKIVLTRHLAKSPGSWFSRKFLLRHCDAVIAVSEFVAKVLRQGVYEPDSPEPERRSRPPLQGDHSKIHVIHGGIDTDRFRVFDAQAQRRAWGLVEQHIAFGVVGGYDRPRGKGQREFLQAAAHVQAKVPNGRFLIIGRGELKPVLESDIGALGLEGKAWLTPYCNDMPAAMNALDCLVHPQVGTEAFPGVVLEAFACGRPVIASALDGIPEGFAVGQCGQLVQPENITALATALVDQAQRPALSMAARQALHHRVAREYSIRARAGMVLKLYEILLGGSPQPAVCAS